MLSCVVIGFLLVQLHASASGTPIKEVPLSKAYGLIGDGKVAKASLDDTTRTLHLTLRNHTELVSGYPLFGGPQLVERLGREHVETTVRSSRATSTAATLLISIIPLIFLVGAMFFLMKRFQGGGLPASVAKKGPVDVPVTRFGDVAGQPEAVDDLREVVQYLQDPDSFSAAGARGPRGVLLVGPPGTGKTLLARAVAGEAGTPFFAVAGSELVEMFVGVGASRVRELFAKARKSGKAIVFIDELDAIGKARSAHSNGGTEERESTLNQLLVELDGFSKSDIVVIAATNRPEILDQALTRAGRFDRRVAVELPDRRGRQQLFELYLGKAQLHPSLDRPAVSAALAARSIGMTGGDIENIVNEAALNAMRDGSRELTEGNLESALERVVMGREQPSRVVSDLGRRVTAWHEAGHVVCALMQEDAANPTRVSIIPRGAAGGVTWRGTYDEHFITRRQCVAELVELFGGRAAEEAVLDGDCTQGAASDIAAATSRARKMVCEWGMSPLGMARIDPDRAVGEEAVLVRAAVEELLGTAMVTAREIIEAHRDLVVAVAEALLEHETLDGSTLLEIKDRVRVGKDHVS